MFDQISSVNRDVFNAAQDLGAKPSYAFWRSLVAIIFPSLCGLWLMGVLWMMDDFLITHLFGRREDR